MDISINYRLKSNLNKAPSVRRAIVAKIESIVKDLVNEYVSELEQHIGSIPGAAAYKDENVSWAPLELEPGETGHKFWYETGETARAVVVNIRVTDKGVKVFAGIPKASEAYDKAMWNELGFTPQDGDHLIRRPLFLPLAEAHAEELNRRIADFVKGSNIRIQVPV